MIPRGHLSPSQVNMMLRCAKQYEWRYIKDISIPPAFAMVKGDSFDAAVQTAMTSKKVSGRLPPKGELVEVMAAKVEERLPEIDPGEPDVLAAGGPEKASGAFIDQSVKVVDAMIPWAEKYQVKEVQLEQDAEIGGYPMKGIMDLVSGTDVVTDTKLWRDRKQPKDAENSNQLRIYNMLRRRSGEKVNGAEYVGLYPLAYKWGLQELAQSNSEEAENRMEDTVSLVGQTIEAGLFAPVNLDSQSAWICSEKFCGFWSQCEYGKKARART